MSDAKRFITDKFGPVAETITIDRGKLELLLDEYLMSLDTEGDNPEMEAVKVKFNDWLTMDRLKAPANWIDLTAEFVIEQIRERESWAEVIEG